MKKMSRIFIGVCLLGVFAFTTSCKKNEEKTSFQVTMPQITEEMDGRMYIEFPSKISKWELGDQIMVYNLNPETPAQSKAVTFTAIALTANGGETARFEEDEEIGEVMGDYYRFFYPASAASGVLEDNKEEFVIAPTQNYRQVDMLQDDGTYQPVATVDLDAVKMACSKPVTDHFAFEPITGVLRLRVTNSNKAVSSIVVTDNTFNLSGNVSMNLFEIKEETKNQLNAILDSYKAGGDWEAAAAAMRANLGYSSWNTGKTMTLNCAEPVQLTTSGETWFYIALRPQALGNGYTVRFNFSDGTYQDVVMPANPEKCIKPSVIKNATITL